MLHSDIQKKNCESILLSSRFSIFIMGIVSINYLYCGYLLPLRRERHLQQYW
jgi:hypothetical protein